MGSSHTHSDKTWERKRENFIIQIIATFRDSDCNHHNNPWTLWKRADIQNFSRSFSRPFSTRFYFFYQKRKVEKKKKCQKTHFLSLISTEEDDGWECCHGDRHRAKNKKLCQKMSASNHVALCVCTHHVRTHK